MSPPPRLPDGSAAWFVRIRSPTSYRLEPCGAPGWWWTAAFMLWTIGGTLLVLLPSMPKGTPSPAVWVAWGVFIAASTGCYLVVAFRKSVRLDR
ncbi:hypothetical protein [Sphingomonas sp.]|uniref:hypothetical protein n=1 Tax=Sphingomonas sp. TaxID=28214 RepID=UPI001B28E725|nr:hypothetical protein [Sphingomonas sp.]MBO9713060.1 hypothetical protein [Sphingomonas sp.]